MDNRHLNFRLQIFKVLSEQGQSCNCVTCGCQWTDGIVRATSKCKETPTTQIYQVNYKGGFPKLFDLLQDFLINSRHQTLYLTMEELLSIFQGTFTRK